MRGDANYDEPKHDYTESSCSHQNAEKGNSAGSADLALVHLGSSKQHPALE